MLDGQVLVKVLEVSVVKHVFTQSESALLAKYMYTHKEFKEYKRQDW